jgi:hypothetical protein
VVLLVPKSIEIIPGVAGPQKIDHAQALVLDDGLQTNPAGPLSNVESTYRDRGTDFTRDRPQQQQTKQPLPIAALRPPEAKPQHRHNRQNTNPTI